MKGRKVRLDCSLPCDHSRFLLQYRHGGPSRAPQLQSIATAQVARTRWRREGNRTLGAARPAPASRKTPRIGAVFDRPIYHQTAKAGFVQPNLKRAQRDGRVEEANSPRGLAKICQCLRRSGTAAGLLGKASKPCAAYPGRRAAISSLLDCRFRSRADLELEVVAGLRG
jgi:hypothetical protein